MPVPTIAETSGRTGKAYLDMVVSLTRNTKVINFLGLPAISVPCGFTANGLPTAFQLFGRPLQEAALLRRQTLPAGDGLQARSPAGRRIGSNHENRRRHVLHHGLHAARCAGRAR